MGKLISGLRKGTTVHTPTGFYRNGDEPTAEQAKYLSEQQGYKLRRDGSDEVASAPAPAAATGKAPNSVIHPT